MKIKNQSFLYFLLIFSFTLKYIENSTLKELRDCIKEITYSYYMRGKNIQCNAAKDQAFSPEEATSQNMRFFVTTSFTSTVYKELLNILVPYSPDHLIEYANNYTGSPEVYIVLEPYDEKYTMKLYSETEESHYVLEENTPYNEIIDKLEIGDLLVGGGIGLIVYDKIKDETGITSDIIVAYSGGNGYVKTKIERIGVNLPSGESFSNSAYSLFLNNKTNENIGEEGLEEGTIGLYKLSEIYLWRPIKENNRLYSKIIVFRFLNEKDGKAMLKYKNYYGYFNNSKNYSDGDIIELNDKNKDRIKFKHLFIEKTVNKFHNNIVELGESLTYKIVIKNKYKEDYTEDLIVTEFLSDKVTYESHKESISKISFTNDKENKKLIWKIGQLKKGNEIIIEYTVKVKTNALNDESENKIISKGYVGNIPSSTVFNFIGTNLKKGQISLIKKNYDNLKDKFNGTTLINEIYYKSFGVDIGFDKFNITDLIINEPLMERGLGNLNLNETHPYSKAVLNNYWSSLAKMYHTFSGVNEEVDVYGLKEFFYFEDPSQLKREDFIYKENFKTGDILIYTNYNDTEYTLKSECLCKNKITYEKGVYSYIYIEGKGFVGVNYGDKGKPNTIYNRNEFNAKYYADNDLLLYVQNITPVSDEFLEIANYQTLFGKDYYVILRPSLCFDLPYVEDEDDDSGSNTWVIVIFVILGIILFLLTLYFLVKCIKLKNSGKEINMKNLKETPLLG